MDVGVDVACLFDVDVGADVDADVDAEVGAEVDVEVVVDADTESRFRLPLSSCREISCEDMLVNRRTDVFDTPSLLGSNHQSILWRVKPAREPARAFGRHWLHTSSLVSSNADDSAQGLSIISE